MHQRFGLLAHGFDDLGMAASHAAHAYAGGKIDEGVAVRILERHAECAIHHHRHAATAARHRFNLGGQRQRGRGLGARERVGHDFRGLGKIQGFEFGFSHDLPR